MLASSARVLSASLYSGIKIGLTSFSLPGFFLNIFKIANGIILEIPFLVGSGSSACLLEVSVFSTGTYVFGVGACSLSLGASSPSFGAS